MPARSSHPPKAFDVRPSRRVPIAMSVALEVVAELRAKDHMSAQRVVAEVVFGPPPAKNNGR